MKNKSILKIAFIPIWLAFLMYALQFVFGLISDPNSWHVVIGITLLSVLIGLTLVFINKIYLKDE